MKKRGWMVLVLAMCVVLLFGPQAYARTAAGSSGEEPWTYTPAPETTASPAPTPVLSYGMENNSLVKAMQERLCELGYFSGTPTGNYYVQTRRAVAAFEKDRGNTVDGRTVSAELLSIILTGSATTPTPAPTTTSYQELSYGMENDDVKAMQNRLRELGYSVSASGGYWGATRNAVEAFQRAAGLPINGKTATTEMLRLLYSSSAPLAPGMAPTATPTPVPANAPYQTLFYGMVNNSQVRAMQERLYALGFYFDEINGDFDDLTKTAVKSFSKVAGVPVEYHINDTVVVKATPELQELLFSDNAPTGAALDFKWTLNDGVLTISGHGKMLDYDTASNNTWDTNAPWGTGIRQVIIKDGITSIGDFAFSACSQMTSVTIPDSVTTIGWYAFFGCSSLPEIILPSGIETIHYAAFCDCSNLTCFEIPECVTELGAIISGCSSLTNITIPNSVTRIGQYAFHECTGLTSITIPGSVTEINDEAFDGCSNLKTVEISEGVTSIGFDAFYNCNSIQTVVLPRSVTTLCENIFSNTPTIYCYEESDADFWAYAHGYPTVYLDSVDVDTIRTVTLPADFTLPCGESRAIPASVFPTHDDPAVIWTSSNPDAVSVDENGLATALAPGEAVITARVGGVSASVTVMAYREPEAFELSDAEIWVFAKTTTPLSVASVTPEDADLDLTWISSDESVATVDETGLVRALKPGDVTITAVIANDITRHCVVHSCYSVSGIAFEEDAVGLIAGVPRQLTAHVTMNTQQCLNRLVTFSSSDESVATVDQRGLVTPRAAGTAQITASPIKGTASPAVCTVTVADRNSAQTMRLPAATTRVEAEAFAGTAADVYALPASVEFIGPRAFADLARPALVIIPATGSIDIADDAFEGSGVTIECPADSPVEAWARAKGIPTVNP